MQCIVHAVTHAALHYSGYLRFQVIFIFGVLFNFYVVFIQSRYVNVRGGVIIFVRKKWGEIPKVGGWLEKTNKKIQF